MTSSKNDVKQEIKTMPQVLHGERLRHMTSDKGNWPCLGDSIVGAKYMGEEYGIQWEEPTPHYGIIEMG